MEMYKNVSFSRLSLCPSSISLSFSLFLLFSPSLQTIWVKEIIEKLHARAIETGAKIVPFW